MSIALRELYDELNLEKELKCIFDVAIEIILKKRTIFKNYPPPHTSKDKYFKKSWGPPIY